MTLDDFIRMLDAIDKGRPFKVDFNLQYKLSEEPYRLITQDLIIMHGVNRLRDYFIEVARADPPEFVGEVK